MFEVCNCHNATNEPKTNDNAYNAYNRLIKVQEMTVSCIKPAVSYMSNCFQFDRNRVARSTSFQRSNFFLKLQYNALNLMERSTENSEN